MGMTVNWRWSMPQVADPNAQANQMANGIQTLAQGIGDAIGGYRSEQREDAEKARLQSNWKAQFDQAQNQWKQQFEQNKKVQDANLERQRIQDEWLNKWYAQFFADDPEEQEYQALLAKYGDQETQTIGFNPLLMFR